MSKLRKLMHSYTFASLQIIRNLKFQRERNGMRCDRFFFSIKRLLNVSLLIVLVVFAGACKKERQVLAPPSVKTAAIVEITDNSAVGGGSIANEGAGPIIAKGICWSTKPNPTFKMETKTEVEGDGDFLGIISGLSSSTKYYVRAYATNSKGTNYGHELSFSTKPKEKLTIGEEYGGGIVFYVDALGAHGLIAVKEDLNEGNPVSWKIAHNEAQLVISCFGDGVGLGAANTANIVTNQKLLDDGTMNYAAKVCVEYRGGGFEDWYLPSKSELELMYQKKELIGGFSPEKYHSSTGNPNEFWSYSLVDFVNGSANYFLTSEIARVRAIRAF